MFRKQVSGPVGSLNPIVAAEAKQVERTGRNTCSRAESEFLCGDDVAGGVCLTGLTRFCADPVSW
jgi:hypothetical protein